MKPFAMPGSLPVLESNFLPFAHHPHCERHHNHLIWLGSRPLCLGCTCMYGGATVGSVLAFAVPWHMIHSWGWLAIHLALVSLTGLQPWVQAKAYKITARTALGMGSASYWLTGLWLWQPPLNRWVFIGLQVTAFAAVYALMTFLRKRFARNPCANCPLGTYPTCEWNLPRLLADNPDSVFADAKAKIVSPKT